MHTLKNKGLCALSFLFLMGLFFTANAIEKNDPPKKGQKALTTVVFQYTPPSSDPYSQANVENTANWTPVGSACPAPIDDEEAPCSIEVPLDHTMGSNGLEIDPLKVSIQTEETIDDQTFKVLEASDNEQYTNPINRTLP